MGLCGGMFLALLALGEMTGGEKVLCLYYGHTLSWVPGMGRAMARGQWPLGHTGYCKAW